MCTFETGPAIPVSASGNHASVGILPRQSTTFKLSFVEVDSSAVLRHLSAAPNPALRACIREYDYLAEWLYILVTTAAYNLQKSLTGNSAQKRWNKASADKTVRYEASYNSTPLHEDPGDKREVQHHRYYHLALRE